MEIKFMAVKGTKSGHGYLYKPYLRQTAFIYLNTVSKISHCSASRPLCI